LSEEHSVFGLETPCSTRVAAVADAGGRPNRRPQGHHEPGGTRPDVPGARAGQGFRSIPGAAPPTRCGPWPPFRARRARPRIQRAVGCDRRGGVRQDPARAGRAHRLACKQQPTGCSVILVTGRERTNVPSCAAGNTGRRPGPGTAGRSRYCTSPLHVDTENQRQRRCWPDTALMKGCAWPSTWRPFAVRRFASNTCPGSRPRGGAVRQPRGVPAAAGRRPGGHRAAEMAGELARSGAEMGLKVAW